MAAEQRLEEARPASTSAAFPEGAVLLFTFEERTFFRQGNRVFARDLSGAENHGAVPAPAPLALSSAVRKRVFYVRTRL